MKGKYSNLLSAGKIGNMEIPNRVVMAPIGSLNGNDNGQVTSRNISYYMDKVEGGTGLIIVEATYIDDISSKGEDGELGISNNSQTPGMALLTSCIHSHYGTKCALQLCHMGKQLGLADRMESLGPSDMREMAVGPEPLLIRSITQSEIHQLIIDFATAAWRAKIAGFDAVEIHAANGHLLNMFLTPYYNSRTDEYGGSVKNRMRLILEIISAIKQSCGSDFPILVRLTACDFDEDQGITIEDGIAYSKMLEAAGIACLDIVGGSLRNGMAVNVMYDPLGNFVPIAEAIKKSGVKTPIIVAGGITTPEFAEQIIAEGNADFIGLARPLLADSEWVKKLKEGRPDDIVPCIRCCMGCVGTMEEFNASKGLKCAVNPRCNYYEYRNITPLTKKKKIAIVGGGPAGMEAARLATIRGHEVTLYEKRKLGGAMHEANFAPELKPDIQLLIEYYDKQMKKLEVNIINEPATVETILSGNYDAAIVATGAVNKHLNISGLEKPHVFSDFEVTEGKAKELGDSVIIIGGGVIGAEIAVSQAMKGKKVTLTTRRGANMGNYEIASDESSPGQMSLLNMLIRYQVDIKLCTNLKEITDDGIIVEYLSGKIEKISGDSIVLCAGYKPNDILYNELNGKIDELYKIGDCVKARMIGDAVHEGWLLANQI